MADIKRGTNREQQKWNKINGNGERREIVGASRGGGTVYPIEPGSRPIGRPPGGRNKTTNVLKEAILLAAETVGLPEIERNAEGVITSIRWNGMPAHHAA